MGNENVPVGKVNGLSTEHMAAAIVLAALALLVLIRRGFRGVTVNLGA